MRKFIHAKNAGGMVLVFAPHKYRVTIYDLFYSQYAFLTQMYYVRGCTITSRINGTPKGV